MSPWLVATIAMVPAFAVPVAVAMRADANNRIVAMQMCSGMAALILAMMAFAFDQPSFIDLALGLVVLGVPATYLLATFYERWL